MPPDLIVGAAVLALLLALEGVLPFYAGREQRLRHALRNGTLAAVNGIAGALLAPLAVLAITFAERHQVGVGPWLDGAAGGGRTGALLAGAAGFVLFDLWMYAWHRANHVIPFLWRFHQVHHTDTAMDATTALRFHPGEFLISSLLSPLVLIALGMGLTALTVYKAVMLAVILFHHSNVRVPPRLDAALRRVLVPPSMHRVHHSNIPAETNSNYGTVFSLWDRLFGSFRLRADLALIRFGTGRRDGADWQALPRLLALPLQAAATPGQRAADKPNPGQ
jgi:sterol desaturase/sphingolipid hydroxylase (fatty acid hydroxylase superfamily)